MPGCRPGTATDFPCCTVDLYPACCHHYPGGTIGCVSRSLLRRRRPSSLLGRVGFHNGISRPARCSFALRPAGSVDLLRGRFKKCFSPFVTSWTAPCTSGRSESWPGRFCTDVSTVPWQGTPNNLSERSLRSYVSWRKICFGSQSHRGSRYMERVMTVVGSCKLQGRNVLEFITQTVRARFGDGKAPSLVPA